MKPSTVFSKLALMLALAAPAAAQNPDLYDLDKVRDLYLTFSQPNYWSLLLNNYRSKTEIKADLKVDGKTYKDVGVRFRGNTSYTRIGNSEKKGFNIRLDSFVPGQDLYGYDHLNLNNGYHDPTFMREVLTYQIARRYLCAPKANFVRVWLNGQYWGIYINVQQPNKDMFEEWFEDGDGNRYRGFGFPFDNSALVWLGSNVANYRNNYEFKKGDGTDLVKMIGVLNNTPSNQVEALVPDIWSIDQGYWYCIVMNALVHVDSYIGTGKDHFEYHDTEHGRFHILPFDVNESFGAANSGNSRLSIWYNTTNLKRPVLSRTLPLPRLRARYIAHYRTVLDETMSWKYIGGLVNKYQAMIANDVVRDTKKLYPTSAFTSNVTQDYRSGRSTIRGLKPLVDEREQYLRGLSEFQTTQASISNVVHTPAKPKNSDPVWVTAKISGASKASLWWRARGKFLETSMFDDGKHNDGKANDGIWGAGLAALPSGTTVEYYVSAETAAGVMRFAPRNAEFAPLSYLIQHPVGSSPIKINEVLAKNDNDAKDQAGENDDWLELYNTASTSVDVSGMYLSDNFAKPTKWKIPANQVIKAGETLLIWCDEDQIQGPLHASFKLSSAGEEVFLFDKDGKTLVDRLAFGPQIADVSTGRLHDGKSLWVTLAKPTANKVNSISGGVRSFSALDPTLHPITASFGTPKLGTTPRWTLANGPSNSAFVLLLSAGASHVPLSTRCVLLAFPPAVVAVAASDAQGAASVPVPIPQDSRFTGIRVYLQALAIQSNTVLGSNAIEMVPIR